MRVFCGIDWAEDHHDVALVDTDGKLIAKRRISDDKAGFALLLELFADAGDSAQEPIPVAIETSRGLLVVLALPEAKCQSKGPAHAVTAVRRRFQEATNLGDVVWLDLFFLQHGWPGETRRVAPQMSAPHSLVERIAHRPMDVVCSACRQPVVLHLRVSP